MLGDSSGTSSYPNIFGTVEADYLADIRNRTTNSTKDTVAGVLTHLQEKYGQVMLHNLLEQEYIVKKTIYSPCDPIAAVFYTVEELLEFAEITGTLYTQLQAINISYVMLHRKGKFSLAISNWNHMPEVQKTWVRFK